VSKTPLSIDVVGKKMSATEELERSAHTRHQLELWDYFMDARIHFQKALGDANRLPQPSNGMYEAYCKQEQISELFKGVSYAAIEVLDSLLSIQEELTNGNDDIKAVIPAITGDSVFKKRKSSGYSLGQWWEHIHDHDEKLELYHNQVLDKWSKRVQIGTGVMASKRFKALNQTIHAQIGSVLADRDHLLDRTHIIRSPCSIIGKPIYEEAQNIAEAYDEEIFDDTDFYQELLKELIEGNSSLGGESTSQQIKRLKKKQKKLLHSSKDKELKYDVRPEILNFMAPAFPPQCPWNLDDLYSNLFGRGL